MKLTEELFTSKTFLYVMVFLTTMSAVGYIVNQDFDALLFLIAFGIIVHRYNQNMSLVLLIALVATSLFKYVTDSLVSKSGFRSRYKRDSRKTMAARNDRETKKKIKQYTDIKDTYNDLIKTIKSKTAQIKEMTRKIRE